MNTRLVLERHLKVALFVERQILHASLLILRYSTLLKFHRVPMKEEFYMG